MTNHPKFYLFDAGVFRALRPKGPLDQPEEIDGAALEALIFQELRAINENYRMGYELYYWRTSNRQEVDFVLYGEQGLIAIEVKWTPPVRSREMSGLQAFLKDYPMAKAFLLYSGPDHLTANGFSGKFSRDLRFSTNDSGPIISLDMPLCFVYVYVYVYKTPCTTIVPSFTARSTPA